MTPLLLACGLGDTPAVAKLLKRGANMSLMYNAMGDYFFNPLMVAIHSTDIPEKLTRMALAELLINEGVDIQRPRSDGITPLMACMDKCMFETAKELIEHAARCDKEVVRLSLSLSRSCSIAKVLNESFALFLLLFLFVLGRLHYGHVHGDAAW